MNIDLCSGINCVDGSSLLLYEYDCMFCNGLARNIFVADHEHPGININNLFQPSCLHTDNIYPNVYIYYCCNKCANISTSDNILDNFANMNISNCIHMNCLFCTIFSKCCIDKNHMVLLDFTEDNLSQYECIACNKKWIANWQHVHIIDHTNTEFYLRINDVFAVVHTYDFV